MYKNLILLSLALGLFSFSDDSRFNTFSAMAAETDLLAAEERINVLGSNQPKYTPQKAVVKVKKILQTMQARERDFADVYEAFFDKFSDTTIYIKEKMDLVDPFWHSLTNNTKDTRLPAKNRLQLLQQQKKTCVSLVKEEIQRQITRSHNAIQGFGSLIGLCNKYIETQSRDTLIGILDSLLASHLLNLAPTIKGYMPSASTTIHSHISLDKAEIDTYYTQDSRLDALSQLYYIVDYVRPIGILIKAGVQPEAKEWGFAEQVQKYVNGELTLEKPSAFLSDGFLYRKGIEKAEESLLLLQLMSKLNGSVNTGGTLGGDIEVHSLLSHERDAALTEYDTLYAMHRSRVDSYITKIQKEGMEKISASAEFINAALRGESAYVASEQKTQPAIQSRAEFEKNKQKTHGKKRANGRKKQIRPSAKQNPTNKRADEPRLSPQITEGTANNETTLTAKAMLESQGSNLTPVLPIESLQSSLLDVDVEAEDSDRTLNLASSASIPLTLQQEVIAILPEDSLPKSNNNAVSTLPNPVRPTIVQPEPRVAVSRRNGKHWHTLDAIGNPTTKPFTINYVEALNAMSKIGIVELPPRKGGDFRKLVRYDLNGNIIGKIAAYNPATSMIGRELMKVYRDFIAQQLQDREDLH